MIEIFLLKQHKFCLYIVEDRFQPFVIFPNEYDRSKYDYKASCGTLHNITGGISDGLCTCASGYRFVAKDRKCGKNFSWIDKKCQ